MTQVWQAVADERQFVVAAKGAPEAIAELCHLGPARAGRGHAVRGRHGRARACACSASPGAAFAGPTWPESQHDFAFEFLGLVGLADPLRPSVPAAVARMPVGGHPRGHDHRRLSGDRPRHRAPGRPRRATSLLTGERARGAERRRSWPTRVRTATVFARIMPEQKLRIVTGAQGEWRDRGHDRRRRERRAVAQGGAYRHRHGRARHRCRARGVVDRAARRRLRLHRPGRPARAPHLRQSAQGDGLHLRGARADRRSRAAAAAVRPARSCSARCTSPSWRW